MVSFPYTDVPRDWEMAGCPRSLVLDKDDTASAAELVRTAIEREGGGASSLAPAFMERIVRVLNGTLGHDDTKPLDPKELEDAQDHLTERQSVLLKATRSLPRVRFTGGAGSGKTWLAVEKARLLCKQGKRVGLFSYNKGISQYLQDRVSNWRHAQPVFTGEFHEYARRLGVPDGTGPAYFEEELPQLLKDLAVSLQPSSGWMPSSLMRLRTSPRCGGKRCLPPPRTTPRSTPSLTTIRTSTGVGAIPRRMAQARWKTW